MHSIHRFLFCGKHILSVFFHRFFFLSSLSFNQSGIETIHTFNQWGDITIISRETLQRWRFHRLQNYVHFLASKSMHFTLACIWSKCAVHFGSVQCNAKMSDSIIYRDNSDVTAWKRSKHFSTNFFFLLFSSSFECIICKLNQSIQWVKWVSIWRCWWWNL